MFDLGNQGNKAAKRLLFQLKQRDTDHNLSEYREELRNMSDVSSKKTVSIHKINKSLSRMKTLEKELQNVDAKRAVRFQLLHTFMKNYSTKLFLTRHTTDSVSGE